MEHHKQQIKLLEYPDA